MKEKAVLLDAQHRQVVEDVIRKHADIRRWELHAVSVRSNHVHVVVTVIPKTDNKDDGIKPVSYTHLRAHETDSYLVCRLLLEKKK